jgi:DNA transposition AAA+ family ATPase
MDEQTLQQRTRRAFERAPETQSAVADALGLNRSSVSRALRNVGLKYTAVQARILSLLEGEQVQRVSTYRGRSVHREWTIGQ